MPVHIICTSCPVMVTMKYIINGYHNNYDSDLTITHIIIIMPWHMHIYTLYLKYRVGLLRVMEMYIIQATTPLWKDQIVTFWCTDRQLSTEVFTSVCHRNANWIPDPVSQCSTLTSGKNSMKCFCMQNRKAGRSWGDLIILAC